MAGIDVAEFEGAGERYKFLIQPVKDLAANWDLDIAKTLEDYIRKVVEETNRIDVEPSADEHTRHKAFNFAEAALLIHGTTTVYARKVEYVLQQAQNFFDQLKEEENIHEQQQKGGKRRKADEAVTANGTIEEEGADENANPNDEDEEDGQQQRRQPKANYASLGHLLERLCQRRSSLLPAVPISFFPLTDFEKRNVSLCTRTNPTEVFGKKEDFKLNSCHIHQSIALLDFKNITIVNKFSQLTINSQKRDANFVPLEPLVEQSEEDFNDALSCGAESTLDTKHKRQTDQEIERRGTDASAPTQRCRNELETEICGTEATSDSAIQRHDDLTDEDMRADGSTPAPTQQRQIDFENEMFDSGTTLVLMQREADLGQMDGSEATPRATTDRNRHEIPPLNIPSLEFLDPTETVTDQNRPFRPNQNCVMNAIKQIKARNRRIERECREKGVPNVATIKCYIDTRIYRHHLKKRAYTLGLFNTFIADQAVLALNPLIHEEEKRRAELRKRRRKEIQNAERFERAMRRELQRREVDPVMDHPIGSDEQQSDIMQINVEAAKDKEMNDFDDPLDELVAEEIINLPPGEDWADELEQDEHQILGDILEVEDLENSFGRVQNLYAGFEHLNTIQRKRAKSLATKRNFYDDTIFADGDINPEDLPPRPISQMDYDEIIAFHLRKYWTASEQATSTFSEHLQRWESKMTDVLEQEQLHREFCTSTYGDELLERFGGQINSEIDFTKMLAQLPNDYDRSRFLLVALILANMGTVHILTKADDDDEEQSIRLRLLSLKRREFSF